MALPGITVAGMIAGQPHQGGAAWAVLQYVLGFRALGHEVTFVEPVQGLGAETIGFFDRVVADFGLAGTAALLDQHTGQTHGMARSRLLERLRRSEVLFNISGMLRDPECLAAVPRRVFLDLDPAFNQIWHLQGADMGFAAHTHFVTIALNIGRDSCTVPECGLAWQTTLQPVCLEHWPVADAIVHDGLTTVGHWRSYGSVTHADRFHGQKAHAWRELIDLPRLTPQACLPALAIHPDEARDLAALQAAGWTLLDPARLCDTPAAYQRFVQGSKAELGIAKSGYVISRSGWFSDRSIGYLASGRPVIAQDTGFPQHLPVGEGLFAFTTAAEAAAAADAMAGDYARHRRQAREIAEACFDSRLVLPRLLDTVGR